MPAPAQSDKPAVAAGEDDESGESTTRSKALAEFTSLAWKRWDSSADERPLHTGPFGFFLDPVPRVVPIFEEPEPPFEPLGPVSHSDIARSLSQSGKQRLKALFLDQINTYFRFVEPPMAGLLGPLPENDLVLQLLYSTMFAIAAHCSADLRDHYSRAFFRYAEDIVFECCRYHMRAFRPAVSDDAQLVQALDA